MNSRSPYYFCLPRNTNGAANGIALVITLLMLSVITFLAVAFLVMTRRDTSAKNATLDVSAAQAMSETALARAQSEIIARMMAQTDVLAYDYMVSSNYITPGGYLSEARGLIDSNNVNYDLHRGANGNTVGPFPYTPNDWAQNIANLFFDPRPPVFVLTNTDPTRPASDFRYYVDLNRNGMFEGSSFRTANRTDNSNLPILSNTSGQQGEPEWIGVLADPTRPHAKDNLFVGRFAYMVLPIGKTLDLNYIHNQSQSNFNGSTARDEFVRDQGVGSWELNLGGYFRELNTNIYGEEPYISAANRYRYMPPNVAGKQANFNQGFCFDDARAIDTNRLVGAGFSQSLLAMYGNPTLTQLQHDGIDEYATSPITNLNGPFDFDTTDDPDIPSITSLPWPGSYNANMFYDMQDVFDPGKTSPALAGRLAAEGGLGGWPNYPNDENRIVYDRYTYQRMLATIGTGSAPEFGVYVYDPAITNHDTNNFGFVSPTNHMPTLLRTKVNINYDNSTQIALGPSSPMPTNITPWINSLHFFTNAADLLVRSQEFPIIDTLLNNTNYVTALDYVHFSLTNILIYNPTNANFRYSSQLHRMLQLAANIYDTAHNSNSISIDPSGPTNISLPSVFRPIFRQRFYGGNGAFLYITGYTNAYVTDLGNPWRYITNTDILPNYNVYGVPWIVGAVKGLPSFNEVSVSASVGMTRKLTFLWNTTQKTPYQTNQSYSFSVSNHFGVEAWNSYLEPFKRPVIVRVTNLMSVLFTNNSTALPYGTNFFTNMNSNLVINSWPAWNGRQTNASLLTPLLSDSVLFPIRRYSDTPPGFYTDNSVTGTSSDHTFAVHDWRLNVTNTVTYLVQDVRTGAILDFVNLGPVGLSLDVSQEISNALRTGEAPEGSGPFSWKYAWFTNNARDALSSLPSVGVSNQIIIGEGLFRTALLDWPPQPIDPLTQVPYATEQANFYNYLKGAAVPTNLVADDPFQPSVFVLKTAAWQANDPLVHYTPADLLGTNFTYIKTPKLLQSPIWIDAGDNLGAVNWRYDPWPGPNDAGGPAHLNKGTADDKNVILKDPQITGSDAWIFPTNRFPSIGWIGRVHRGTPWQTVFLKADVDPTRPDKDDASFNRSQWIAGWDVFDVESELNALAEYPTNDYTLLDLFTTAPNDNAARGALSINQTNAAAWNALLDGVIVLQSNAPAGIVGVPIDPKLSQFGTYPSLVSYLLDSTNAFEQTGQFTNRFYGVNATRSQTGGLFHRLGDILQTATLTVSSPYVDPNNWPRDEVVERIPQQVASLLKVGQPQFVIYAWGQSLRPQALYNPGLGVLGSANLFKICTNYSITGEFLTRTVCHLDLTKSDRFGQRPKIQIDSFNILPAAQ